MATGDYLTVPRLKLKKIASLFSKIQIDRTTGCWLWTAALNKDGYGRTNIGSRPEAIHRVMYAWLVDPIPRGVSVKTIDHIVCNRTNCCNPAHMALVTNRDNVLRSTAPPAVYARSTHCKRGHELSVVKNRRRCLVCHAASQRAAIARRATAPNRSERLERDKMRQRKKMNGPDRAERLATQRAYYHRAKQRQHKDS